MKRVPWGWLLLGGVLLSAGLGYLYVDRRIQAAHDVLRGLTSYRDRDWQAAEATFTEAIHVAPPLCPDTARAYAGRGHARNQQKEYALAADDFSEAIRRDPGNASAFYGRGAAYALIGELDRALADLGEAIRLDPKNWRPFYNRGLCHFKKGDFDQALADFGEVINRDPKYAKAYLARSEVYAKKGDMAHADEDRHKAAELGASPDESIVE
jgi:tetratricopeptide (TPR) repeat protein